MDHYHLLQFLFMFSLILSLTAGRTLFYDAYDEEPDSQIFHSISNDNDISYEDKEFHQRSVFSTSSASQTREQLIDLLRKAYQQGWKPNLKHYIPATRFGRHRR